MPLVSAETTTYRRGLPLLKYLLRRSWTVLNGGVEAGTGAPGEQSKQLAVFC